MSKILSILLVVSLLVSANLCYQNTFTQDLIKLAQKINSNPDSTWKSTEQIQHWKEGTAQDFQQLNGLYMSPSGASLPLVETVADEIPENFDSREKWSKCESIKEVRDQANCGSCWAFSAAEAFSDRWCIASGQKDQTRMSSQQILTCCDYCGNGCAGGWHNMAWVYFQESGAVSGNLYGQDNYCQSYFLPPCDHHVKGPLGPCPPSVKQPACSYECNSNFDGTYGSDRHYTVGSGMTNNNVKAMQTEIMTNGPIQGAFTVYSDFYTYKSGVYQHLEGDFQGGHAIKILGWGVEDGTPYWLCANSWNTSWGEGGFFKILRGANECGIEDTTAFGYVK
ncbi:hypothetical protein PPERSA_02939 [Pseudocohnilembus persalinus]|uniref:Peptidase C1A papain C-terminal domain-containing protein n=1 Tax=Pseudocohnilembus persalinus TaxID=266149 RepID=A0A0V0QA50_PSEPJ|nr:hypothetical protein PPERSA_02939 [Pseudocohnilembus persalinus]|eukprot:KRW99107.1 hypothetical protein PPERSA_02939 [Pseudocohnilembus persalinus]